MKTRQTLKRPERSIRKAERQDLRPAPEQHSALNKNRDIANNKQMYTDDLIEERVR